MSRLTELFVNSDSCNVYELCDKVTEPANLLHTLVLSDKDAQYSPDGPERIPHNLFSGHTPRLRSLHIRGLVIHWDSPLLCPTLTSLVIVAFCHLKEARGTFEHLLSALEPMESLRTLELTNAIPRARKASDMSPPSRVIVFPNLFRLTGRAHCSAHFIDHISLPINVLPHSDATIGNHAFSTLFSLPRPISIARNLCVLCDWSGNVGLNVYASMREI